jgi:hypothetical protein
VELLADYSLSGAAMTVDVDLNDYVMAGYFITKYVRRTAFNETIERRILSVSDCAAPVVPSVYVAEFEAQFRAAYEAFGITPEIYSTFSEWNETHWKQPKQQIGWLRIFCSLETAREFIQRFVTIREDVVILGVAIPSDEVDEFIGEETRNEPNSCGLFDMIVRRQIPPVGQPLGFEMLSYTYDQFTNSWLCDDFDHHLHNEIGLELNEHHLINSREEALRVDRYMDEDADLKIHGPWSYWLIIKYPLESEA